MLIQLGLVTKSDLFMCFIGLYYRFLILPGHSKEDITSSNNSILEPPKTMLASRPCFVPMHRKGSIAPVEDEALPTCAEPMRFVVR